MVGRVYEYYPTAVALNTELEVGEEVMVASLPQGELQMLDVYRIAECSWEWTTIYQGNTYRRRKEYTPTETAKTYSIFLRDLTIK